MKLSARNQIKGKVVEVHKGATTAHVRIDIGNGVVITSSITNEAVEDLGLAVGDDATAVIKASDVMWRNSDRSPNWCECTAPRRAHEGNGPFLIQKC
jgi:molybdopterin-binding protein